MNLGIKARRIIQSILSCILISVLTLSVMSPIVYATTNHEYTVAEQQYERTNEIKGEILDFSALDFSKSSYYNGATLSKGDTVTGSYSIKKIGNDYNIRLENVTAKKIILPTDIADGDNGKNALAKDDNGNITERQTHITIELVGVNEILGYGIQGYYVKGLTIKGNGSLRIVTHLEDRVVNGETEYYIIPGISIETDAIDDIDNEKGFIIDSSRITIVNPYYWGIVCNGDIELKNESKLEIQSFGGIKKKAESGAISTDKLIVNEGCILKTTGKVQIFRQAEQNELLAKREQAKYASDLEQPIITAQTQSGEEVTNDKIYCESPIVKVTDNMKIKLIKVNGETIRDFITNTDTEKTFNIPMNMDTDKEVVVTDMNNNTATFKFRSNYGHTLYGKETNRIEATCTENGHVDMEYICLICKQTINKETIELKATGHTYKDTTYSTYIEHKCTKCGDRYITEIQLPVQQVQPQTQNKQTQSVPATNKQTTQNTQSTKTETKQAETKTTTKTESKPVEQKKVETKQTVKAPVKSTNTIAVSNSTKTASTKVQSFSLKVKQTGNGKVIYKSDNKNVTVNSSGKVTVKAKFIGKATITVTTAETSKYKKATKKVTVTVNPQKVSISKLTNNKGRKLAIKWSKNVLCTGYQLQYSTDKNFKKGIKTVTITKNSTLSKTLSKLSKNKKYYVRIRGYKTVSKVKYYSVWSSVKNIKIRK